MKTSFKSITNISRNKSLWGGLLASLLLWRISSAHQLPTLGGTPSSAEVMRLLESGQGTEKNLPLALFNLSQGRYEEAILSLNSDDDQRYPWLRSYLTGLVIVSKTLVPFHSEHFDLYVPPGQEFLHRYALPSLEKAAAFDEKTFHHRPAKKIRVEIYPTKEDFSAASTLSVEILERSGAIGICKFHRLMILSPKTLPLGYRWMDAMAHEYNHLIINELSSARTELWLHEGTAHYFDTGYRISPPDFLSPKQQTDLMIRAGKNDLISFERMSPSLVYLKNQEEVSLAFSQVSYGVSLLNKDYGTDKFVRFLISLANVSFDEAFKDKFQMTTTEFEEKIKRNILKEPWEKVNGALGDDIHFGPVKESDYIGADAEGKTKLGDRMRTLGRTDAALVEYEEALIDEPDNGVILLKAAKMNLAFKNTNKAIEELRRATTKNPNYGTPHVLLASLVPPDEAIPLLETANALNPFDPAIHQLWADNLRKSGKPVEAIIEDQIFQALSK